MSENIFTLVVEGREVKDFTDYKEALREAHKIWLEGLDVFIDTRKNTEEQWTMQPVTDEVIERSMKKVFRKSINSKSKRK